MVLQYNLENAISFSFLPIGTLGFINLVIMINLILNIFGITCINLNFTNVNPFYFICKIIFLFKLVQHEQY